MSEPTAKPMVYVGQIVGYVLACAKHGWKKDGSTTWEQTREKAVERGDQSACGLKCLVEPTIWTALLKTKPSEASMGR